MFKGKKKDRRRRRTRRMKCRRNAMNMKKEIKSRANAQRHKACDQRERRKRKFSRTTHNNCAQVCKHCQMEKVDLSQRQQPPDETPCISRIVFLFLFLLNICEINKYLEKFSALTILFGPACNE